jgi:hypothetical protein
MNIPRRLVFHFFINLHTRFNRAAAGALISDMDNL